MRYYIFLVIMVIFVGFQAMRGEKVVSYESTVDFAGNIHNYLWANYLQFNGKVQQAHQWYKNILATDSSLYVHKGYLFFLYEAGNYASVIQLMPRVKGFFDDDAEVQLIFYRSLRHTNDKKRAEELIIALSSACKKNIEIAFEVAQLYIERKELDNALQTIDEVLNNSPKKGNFFVFYFLKAQIYTLLNNYPKSLENITLCLESNPRFDKCWLLKGIIKEQEGNIQEAITCYRLYLETTDKMDKKVQEHLLELFLRINNEHKKQVFKQQGFWYTPQVAHYSALYVLFGNNYGYVHAFCTKDYSASPMSFGNNTSTWDDMRHGIITHQRLVSESMAFL